MTARKLETAEEGPSMSDARIPSPVPDGTVYMESLGRWVDNLMGDARMRRRTKEELKPLQLRDEEIPDEPPPAEPPPPVPDGTDDFTKGVDPDKVERRDR